MSIDIYQLKINILTLIPNNPLIELTSDILFTEKKTIDSSTGGSIGGSKFPFFTDSKLYPINKLESFEYTDIIKFFFNKTTFIDTINTNNNNTKTQKKKHKKNIKKTTMNHKQKDNTGLSKNQIKFKNFKYMLQLLFPTTFPSVNNIKTSLFFLLNDSIDNIPFESKKKIKGGSDNLSFKGTNISSIPLLPSKFNKKFSYLNIKNTIYTITNVIWINDVMNHPIYKQIIINYNLYEKWKINYEEIQDKKNAEIELEIVKRINKLMSQKINAFDLNILLTNLNNYNINNNKRVYYRRNFYDEEDEEDNDPAEKYNTELKKDVLKRCQIAVKQLLRYYDIETKKFKTKMNDLNTVQINHIIVDNFKHIVKTFREFNGSNRIFNSEIIYELKSIISQVDDYFLNQEIIFNYLGNLNFDFLNDNSNDDKRNNKMKKIRDIIEKKYSAFNEFVKKIKYMRNRKIDNPIWKNTITKIIEGENDHGFENIWNEINDCYAITERKEDEDEDEDSEDEVEKRELEKKQNLENFNKEKQQIGGIKIKKCNNSNSELNVGFDIIVETEIISSKDDIKMIEIYLQMDIIEGKVNEQNMDILKCPYYDSYLGNMYEYLKNNPKKKWDISEQKFFFNGKEILEKYEKDMIDKKNKIKNNK